MTVADNELIMVAAPMQATVMPAKIGSVVTNAITSPATITPKDIAVRAGKIAPLLFFMLSIADFMGIFMRSDKLRFGFFNKVVKSLFSWLVWLVLLRLFCMSLVMFWLALFCLSTCCSCDSICRELLLVSCMFAS